MIIDFITIERLKQYFNLKITGSYDYYDYGIIPNDIDLITKNNLDGIETYLQDQGYLTTKIKSYLYKTDYELKATKEGYSPIHIIQTNNEPFGFLSFVEFKAKRKTKSDYEQLAKIFTEMAKQKKE